MYAALIRASQTWKRIVISDFELKQVEELRAELAAEFEQRHSAASSRNRTPAAIV